MLTLLLAALLAQSPQDEPPAIVVTGQRTVTQHHEECQRTRCEPVRDANATLAYAQQQVLAGEYRDARNALSAALRRTRGAARTHPQAVSALYSAHSTVSLHLGEQDDFRRSGLRAIGVVRDAFGQDDPRSIAARARAGDVEASLGRYLDADRAYRAAAEDARHKGLELLAHTLELRRAWLLSLQDQGAAARSRLVRVATDADADPRVRMQAAVMAAQVANRLGDEDTAAEMLAIIGRQPPMNAPVLVYSPRIELVTTADALASSQRFGEQSGVEPRSSDHAPLRWVDVGFWVRPDGTVEDAAILRGSRAQAWARPVLVSISARRYAPFDGTAGDPGRYRVERFTLTAEVLVPKGSLIARRAGPLELRWLDVTGAPDPRELL